MAKAAFNKKKNLVTVNSI